MRLELDHLFVCTHPGAPEAEKLLQFGLLEGPPNQHPGQGTANRRFPFLNAMIELLWVSDRGEAQSENTRRTLLWERWSERKGKACPFGICLRPADSADSGPPFPAWEYRPAYLSAPLLMHIGHAGIDEPMWVYLGFMRRVHHQGRFREHPAGLREITGLTLTTPLPLRSQASQTVVAAGILKTQVGAASQLDIQLDGGRRALMDFRPHLPLTFRF